MATPTAVAAYLLLFVGAGFSFLFANLLLGKLCRPRAPNSEKLEVYECGEPTIGSSFVQFDLRFYVVALLFIIFDVEVAFFFPWAAVFGKATQLMDPNLAVVQQVTGARGQGTGNSASAVELTPAAVGLYRELGVNHPTVPPALAQNQSAATKGATKSANAQTPLEQADAAIRSDASILARLSMIDIGAFFAVLLVGFAYVWRRGDLDWVRAVSRERSTGVEPSEPPLVVEQHPVISA
jgi:NADH-quinone oxidoreductase subunit A